LEGCYIEGTATTDSLKISFGDIAPGQSKIAYWIMTVTLNGTFTAFTATYTHSNALGGAETSLIQAVNTHILMRDIMTNQTSSAFLVAPNNKTAPDQLVDSASGAPTPVVQAAYNITHMNSTSLTLATQKQSGSWIWINLTDPFNNQEQIIQVQRSDGKILNKQNYWMGDGRIYIVDDPEKDYTILFRPPHDIAVTNVSPSKTVVGQGFSNSINVTVTNQGSYTETFKVTVFANATSIASQTVTLTSGNSTAITVTWNTAGFAYGSYTISASVTLATGETNSWTGPFTYGTVKVTIPGASVGGIYIPVNKVELLAPYIGLTILLAIAVSTIGYVKKRKRHTEINS
jgi:hypothetical protein